MSKQTYNRMMTHSVSVIKRSQDFSGDLSDSETFDEDGFVEYTNTQMISDDGEKITAKAIIYLKSDTNFDETHDNWVFEHNGQRFIKRTTERIDDPRTGKTHHYELGCV